LKSFTAKEMPERHDSRRKASGHAVMKFRSRTSREDPEINFIPLIDVLLVILIFLMVTTTYSRFAELQINLPTAEAGSAAGTAGANRCRSRTPKVTPRSTAAQPPAAARPY